MRLRLDRWMDNGEATAGRLYVNDRFICYTLEDQHQDMKIAGETRIPSGVYPIVPRRFGRFFDAYMERWGHDFVPELEGVPGFTDILIHTGNTDDHTAGCILVGKGFNDTQGNFTVHASRDAYKALYDLIERGFHAGEDISIEINDEDARQQTGEAA